MYSRIQRKDSWELDSPQWGFADKDSHCLGQREMYLVSISIVFGMGEGAWTGLDQSWENFVLAIDQSTLTIVSNP